MKPYRYISIKSIVNIHKFLYFKQEQNQNLFSILLFLPYPINTVLSLCVKNITKLFSTWIELFQCSILGNKEDPRSILFLT